MHGVPVKHFCNKEWEKLKDFSSFTILAWNFCDLFEYFLWLCSFPDLALVFLTSSCCGRLQPT